RNMILSVFLFLAASPRVQAQSAAETAVISGTVLDPDGKVVQNAPVIVRNESTGSVRTTVTDTEGRFSVPDLPAGDYALDVTAPGFATAHRAGVRAATGTPENISVSLSLEKVAEEVTVSEFLPLSTILAPSQSSLEARSAQSEISQAFIQNFTAPTADYTEVVNMAPGTFSFAPNGVGLGDSKTFFRGFKDGDYTMTFDGIPFKDTNSPTHHSWAFFPAQFIGTTVFDRSPGSASTIGPTNFGGSINMLSHQLLPQQNIRATVNYGSFNTRMYDARYDSGFFGPGGKSNLLIDVHQMKSDGYQTYNFQRRNAFEAKYQYSFSSKARLTLFSSIVELKSNTPNIKGPTRAQVAQFGDNYLMSNDPARADYYKYNFYHIPSDFDYAGFSADLGHGWSLDTKVYTYRYYNKQNFNGATISATSATDKLNSYRKYGNLLPVSQTSKYGVLRIGMWSEYAKTDRFQTPSDPRTWVDAALPNFHEKFNTATLQPYAEYEYRITPKLSLTPGVKFSDYKMDFTQFADNGKTVGNLNGAPFVQHAATFTAWQPSFDARYKLHRNWSVYGQYATGNSIPPTNVFDVKNGKVAVLPKPTQVRTVQFGSVYKTGRFTLDVDSYFIHFDSGYSSNPDANGEPVYYLSGTSRTRGVEAESSVYFGHGISAYMNGTAGVAKYNDSTNLWVQQAPRDTETVGLSYQQGNWDLGFFNKRIGRMFNDNGAIHQAIAINPFEMTNLFLNYTIKNVSEFSQTKIRLSINNLFDQHNIVAVALAGKGTATGPDDVLTLMAARSVMLSMTFGFSPRR
ncbi:MAG TPA: TonB-dependent receptor, partial [Terriglobia bacterium]|nr:TonB-dependent receptor [Terriglobia bacterium]